MQYNIKPYSPLQLLTILMNIKCPTLMNSFKY